MTDAIAVLIVWIGLCGLAGLSMAVLLLTRFPEVFFGTRDYKSTRRWRMVRVGVIAGYAVAGAVVLVGVALLTVARSLLPA